MHLNISRDTAVTIFMNILIAHCRNGTIKEVYDLLEDGPPVPEVQSNQMATYQWYQTLNEQGKQHIQYLVREIVDSTLFSTLVVLDGAAGGLPLQEQFSEFALYLQTYETEADEAIDNVKTRVRVNTKGVTEDLHDIFINSISTP